MKLHEVLEIAKDNPEIWFRPVSWKGAKQAFIVENNQTKIVPTLCGGNYYMMAWVKYLMEDWEIVSCDTVLNGQ